jgi:hypothetical protein
MTDTVGQYIGRLAGAEVACLTFIETRQTTVPGQCVRAPVDARCSHAATKLINEADFVRQTDDPIDELNEDR